MNTFDPNKPYRLRNGNEAKIYEAFEGWIYGRCKNDLGDLIVVKWDLYGRFYGCTDLDTLDLVNYEDPKSDPKTQGPSSQSYWSGNNEDLKLPVGTYVINQPKTLRDEWAIERYRRWKDVNHGPYKFILESCYKFADLAMEARKAKV